MVSHDSLFFLILRWGAAEAAGMGFVCFIVFCVLLANRVFLGSFCLFHTFQILPPSGGSSVEKGRGYPGTE